MEELNRDELLSSPSPEETKEAAHAADIEAIRNVIRQINNELEEAAGTAEESVSAKIEKIKNDIRQLLAEPETTAFTAADTADTPAEAGTMTEVTGTEADSTVNVPVPAAETAEAAAEVISSEAEYPAEEIHPEAEPAAAEAAEVADGTESTETETAEETEETVPAEAGPAAADTEGSDEVVPPETAAAEIPAETADEAAVTEIRNDIRDLNDELEASAKDDRETPAAEPVKSDAVPAALAAAASYRETADPGIPAEPKMPEAEPLKQEPPANMPPLPAREEKKETQEVKTDTKPTVKTRKKSGNGLTLLLAALLGMAGGFGGGVAAVKMAPAPEPVTVTAEPAENTPEPEKTPVPAATPAPAAAAPSISEVAAKAKPSVVEILIEVEQHSYGFFGGTYISEGAGSGVIITDDGYIITNNHVVEDALSIKVTLYDGTTYDATLIGTDEKSDIGVIKIDASGLTPAEIGDSDTLQVGDPAIVIGNPLGTLGGTVTSGIISATEREVTINQEAMNLIQTDATINSGNSGGGLFDKNGKLVGIVNAKDSGTTSSGALIEGLGFAIPVNQAINVADQLMTSGRVTNRATLGVYIQTLEQDTQEYKAGLYITSVMNGSGAEEAGLEPYDRIAAADGSEVMSYQDLSKVLRKKNVGDTIDLTIERDGEMMDVTVTLTGPIEESEKS